jgi:hypothetical protein
VKESRGEYLVQKGTDLRCSSPFIQFCLFLFLASLLASLPLQHTYMVGICLLLTYWTELPYLPMRHGSLPSSLLAASHVVGLAPWYTIGHTVLMVDISNRWSWSTICFFPNRFSPLAMSCQYKYLAHMPIFHASSSWRHLIARRLQPMLQEIKISFE